MKLNVNIFFAFLFSALLVAGCASDDNSENEASQPEQEQAEKAPDFEVTTIDGNTISLKQSMEEDKPVVVYFMASWCSTCARNWPALSEVYPEFENDLTFVAISIDPSDSEDVIRKLAKDRNFKFPSTEGHPQVMLDFGVSNQATTVGVDRQGNIVFKKPGQALSADEYRSLFAGLIN